MNESRREDVAIVTTEKDPFWYKRAIIYELHVRSFFDSNADGIGDFPGLTQKLDYLQELGITAIWLLPFYPSPLRDDGYDIADYYSINPMYGNLDHFRTFLQEAHARGLRVITELVINHTSDQHPWFQRARRSPPGSNYRDYYVWSDDPLKYKNTRIVFKDFEPSNWTWDPVANSYYWHRFFFHQPDLNFDNPEVHHEIIRILDFWLDLGVDGMRLDAIPYLYEREGTGCESLPETHAFLKKLRKHVDQKYGDRMFLAEANQWPEDAVAFFGDEPGDECHMAFHFPLMPRLFMSVRMEDRFPIVDILNQTPPIPESSAWAIFLRNHDELTLEMVTDEERDFMYRMYAMDTRARINLGIRRRLAPLLQNDRRKIELLTMVLLSLPGTPVMYYGDEIGMGDNTYLGDRNGVRTPMHWSSDKNAGFSRAAPHALVFPIVVDPEYHYESINVEAQQQNPNSLLWWARRVIALRKRWNAFAEGELEFLHPANRKVLAFLRKTPDQTLLIVANLSRYAQAVTLKLDDYCQCVPLELFGQTLFPAVTIEGFPLTLSPYAAFWFAFELQRDRHRNLADLPTLHVKSAWTELLSPGPAQQVESRLPAFLKQQSWFVGRSRTISSVTLSRALPLSESIVFTVLTVEFNETDAEEYLLPLTIEGSAMTPDENFQAAFLARVRFPDGRETRLFDATAAPRFWHLLLEFISGSRRLAVPGGEITAFGSAVSEDAVALLQDFILRLNLNNSSASAGEFFIKLIRRIECGINPELELTQFLSRATFPNVPPVLGGLEFSAQSQQRFTWAIVTAGVPSARNAWDLTFDALARFLERASAAQFPPTPPPSDWLELIDVEPTEQDYTLLGAFPESIRLLGQRTAELHQALATNLDHPDFAPEEFAPFSQRSLYQSMRNLVLRTLQSLISRLPTMNEVTAQTAQKVIAAERDIIEFLKSLYELPFRSYRSRIHGNFNLGQVLHTGKDFIFIDFEGETDRPYGERRIKRTPLRDVAGILRSLHQVSHAALQAQVKAGHIRHERVPEFSAWLQYWRAWISAIFLKGYQGALESSNLLPHDRRAFRTLLYSMVIEAAFTELSHEPGNSRIALDAILEVLNGSGRPQ